MLAVLVERGGADAVQFATGQRRLQQVAGVHRPFRLARSHDGVQFVDEEDDAALLGLDLAEHAFQAFFEFTAVLRSGDQCAHVEGKKLLVLQTLGHVTLDDAQGKAFRDRRLTDAGLTDQYGVVLRPARKNLDRAADLLVSADHRIEFAGGGRLGQIARVALQGIVRLFGGCAVGGAAFANVVDGRVEALSGDAGISQHPCCLRALLQRERQQQTFGRYKLVAGFVGNLFRVVENTCELRGHVELPRAAPGNLGPFGQCALHCRQRIARATARAVDETGGQAFLVVEENLQKMFRGKLLVAFAEGKALRRLDESLGAIGIAIEIHRMDLSRAPLRPRRGPAGGAVFIVATSATTPNGRRIGLSRYGGPRCPKKGLASVFRTRRMVAAGGWN